MRQPDDMTREERHELHNAKVLEVKAGEISGKEFVDCLVNKVGLTVDEAKHEYNMLLVAGDLAISNLKNGDHVLFEHRGHHYKAAIKALYSSGMGAIVRYGSTTLPFALFELRTR